MLSKKISLQKATLTNNYVACASNYNTNTEKGFLKNTRGLNRRGLWKVK